MNQRSHHWGAPSCGVDNQPEPLEISEAAMLDTDKGYPLSHPSADRFPERQRSDWPDRSTGSTLMELVNKKMSWDVNHHFMT